MVAETQAARTRKQPVPYVPTVEVIDYQAGAFAVQSQSNPEDYYIATVQRGESAPSCTCKAGQTGFASCKYVTYCKHIRASQIVDGALAALVREQQDREAAHAGEQAPAPTFTLAPDYLMAAYE